MIYMKTVQMNNVEKWKKICLEADVVSDEVLDCQEAKNDLTAEQLNYLLEYFGDDDFVFVDSEKEFHYR